MAGNSVEHALEVARSHHRSGQLAAAVAIYQQVLAQYPYYPDAWHLLGIAALDSGRCEEARKFIEKAIGLAPWKAVYYSDLGLSYQRQERLKDAVPCFQRALTLQADLALVHYNLGKTLRGLGRTDEAVASYQRALDIQPNLVAAWNNLGNALTDRGDMDRAVDCFQKVLTFHPQSAEAHSNLANTYLEMGRWDAAITSSRSALFLNPYLATAHGNLGTALFRKGMFSEAENSYRTALRCEPGLADVHWSLGLVLLLLGRYEEGWKEHEWRPQSPAGASAESIFFRPSWDGRPIAGQTLLLHAEQGFGDTIQFLRYVSLVRRFSKAARVILLCQPELKRLLDGHNQWEAEIIARSVADEGGLPPCDQHLPLLSLPLALRRYEPLAMTEAYLQAETNLRSVWRQRLKPSGKLRVGLAWAGNPQNAHDRSRSITSEKLLPLLRIPRVEFYSLQIRPGRKQPAGLMEAGLVDLTPDIADFADTAALLSELDLIISVDTAVAHLAGALGRPVRLLLPYVPDWRWGLHDEITPWYSTIRLIRQQEMDNWDNVLEQLIAELFILASQH